MFSFVKKTVLSSLLLSSGIAKTTTNPPKFAEYWMQAEKLLINSKDAFKAKGSIIQRTRGDDVSLRRAGPVPIKDVRFNQIENTSGGTYQWKNHKLYPCLDACKASPNSKTGRTIDQNACWDCLGRKAATAGRFRRNRRIFNRYGH